MFATDDTFVSVQTVYNLFPFSVIEFCEVNKFKPWTICAIEIRDSFFLATCATFLRIMTLYFTM